MTDFEFLSVLISIVIGLGLTHLLKGLGHVIYHRHLNGVDPVHTSWALAVFVILILNWWVVLLWRDVTQWSFSTFFTMVIWCCSFYALALSVFPPGLSDETDYRQLFEENRSWILGTFIIMTLLDQLVTFQRERHLPELYYLAYVGHYTVLAGIGLLVRRRIYDLVLGWYLVVTLLLWSFGVRGVLT